MKTIQEIKTDIDVLVRKQGNQGALKLGDVLDGIVDIVQTINNTLDKFKAQITNKATFHAAVPTTATEIVFAFSGDVDLTGYTKSGSVGEGIDVYADGTKYAVVSAKIIYAPENSAEFFRNYTALTSLNLSNFNTSNVTNMNSMFNKCAALTSLDLSNFNTSNVTNMSSMFNSCASLTSLDLSNFNTSNVTAMNGIFYGCAALASLNLSNFNTTNVEDMYVMFDGCSGLTTIIANNWSAAGDSSGMFNGCTSLVGGNGTAYDASHVDASYAHIDVAGNPGYFTAPA